MLSLSFTRRYKKSLHAYLKSGQFNNTKLEQIVYKLVREEALEPKYKDHQLHGTMAQYRECHIDRDVLLLYEIYSKEKHLELVDIGSHSDLLK